jgi:hypothetical protein
MQHAFGLNIPQTLNDICDPTRLALIMYDMQVGIVKQIEDGDALFTNVETHVCANVPLEAGTPAEFTTRAVIL